MLRAYGMWVLVCALGLVTTLARADEPLVIRSTDAFGVTVEKQIHP